MAEIIEIPFSFEFRKGQAEWSLGTARITGWAKRPETIMWANQPDAKVDGSALMAEVQVGQDYYTVEYPRKKLPEGKWDNLWMEAYTNEDVEKALQGWESIFLIPSFKSYADEAELKKHSQPANAWHMREEFLRLKLDYETAKAFLNEWGRWNLAPFLELQEIIQLQGAIREALTAPPDNWFASTMSIPPIGRRIQKFPYFGFLSDLCEVALRMTVTIDLLRNTEFKLCAKPDCRQPFKIVSKHTKKYCSKNCEHAEAMRRKRKKDKKKETV